MIQEKKRCCHCINCLFYGMLSGLKCKCKVKNITWVSYTKEDYDRLNAKHCEHFTPPYELRSSETQEIINSKEIKWI